MIYSKPCTGCHVVKTADNFHKHSKNRDGLAERCKDCRKIETAIYRDNNRDKIKESNKRYRMANPEKVAEAEKKKPSRQPEYLRAYRRNYYLQTAEKQKEKSKEWRANNPEQRRVQERRRRALEYGAITEPYTTQQVLDLYGTDCRFCGLPIDFNATPIIGDDGWQMGLHLDHVIPLTKGGSDTLDNIRPSHALCNIRRMN